MLKRLLHMLLFITASLVIIILLISPMIASVYFDGMDMLEMRKKMESQYISPKRLYITCWRNIKALYVDPTMNHQNWNRWKYKYLKYIKTDEDVYVAVNTILASLNDGFSEFYDSNQFDLQEKYINKNTESKDKPVGGSEAMVELITIAGVAYSATITQSAKNYENPRKGDIILKVNNYPIKGLALDSAIDLITGQTSISKVELLRGKKIYTFPIARGVMTVGKVFHRHLGDGIIYVSAYTLMGRRIETYFSGLEGFYQNKGIEPKGFIMDLRSDMGGLFLNSLHIADSYIEEGDLVTIKYRNNSEYTLKAKEKNYSVPKQPIVILIDKKTASSCEILAGILRSNNRAVLLGETSFGKNMIQQRIPLPNRTCLNLTTATYSFPNGYKTYNGALKPDYEVKLTPKDIINGDDKQLKKAIQIIKEKAKEIEKEEEKRKAEEERLKAEEEKNNEQPEPQQQNS